MKTILFYDSTCPRAYGVEDVDRADSGLGGTEAVVVRVAERLGEEHSVFVAQRRRRSTTRSDNVRYVGLGELDDVEPDAIVVLRKFGPLRRLRRRYPDAGLFIWFHDWFFSPWRGGPIARFLIPFAHEFWLGTAARAQATAVLVSRAHQQNAIEFLHAYSPGNRYADHIETCYVHNPVVLPDLPPAPEDGPGFDRDKLVFFSAPFKGLDRVLEAFDRVTQAFPRMKLYVACPAYARADLGRRPNVVALGKLDHKDVLEHVRSALCCFYPADTWPETFGLVLAEANALGTPVLAHPFGAAPEVLSEEQLCDARDLDAVVERIERWRQPGGRPLVGPRDEFHIDTVARRWNEILFGKGDER